jgi:hypothetical protein
MSCSVIQQKRELTYRNLSFFKFFIGLPFRGCLVWRCAFRSEWPAHWLHKFYSSWYDCQSHLNQETWVRNGRWNLLTKHLYARKVLLRHGTDGFTSPPKEVVLRIFITLKNRSGSNPQTLGPVASTLTTSPPRATYRNLLTLFAFWLFRFNVKLFCSLHLQPIISSQIQIYMTS